MNAEKGKGKMTPSRPGVKKRGKGLGKLYLGLCPLSGVFEKGWGRKLE